MKDFIKSLEGKGLYKQEDGSYLTQEQEGRIYFSDLKKIIKGLPEDQQEVLMMRIYQDLSFKEISDLTGVSINTALGRMRYALMNMRKVIEKNQIILSA